MSIIKYLLLFFIFFPYINPLETPWSLQPFALLFSILYVLFKKNLKIDKYILGFLFVGFISIVISIISINQIVNSLRSIANYISLPFIVWAVYLFNPTSLRVIRLIKVSAYIYVGIGIIQMFIIPGFLSFLVPHQGDSEILSSSGRGVCSLAPEPSYFGFILLLYFYFGLLIKDKILAYISIFGLIFLAQSFTVIFCLFISIAIYFSFKSIFNFFVAVSLILLIIVLGIIIIPSLDMDTRFITLAQSMIFDGLGSTVENDASATGRLYHITYPISNSFYNFFIPFGYNGLPNGDTRILSGIAGAIYELGFFSFIMFYLLLAILFYRNKFDFNIVLCVGIGLIMFILNANQIGMPIFCFIISYLLYLKKYSFNEA